MTETEKLETYFLKKLPDVLDDGSEFPILLVVLGLKEGAVTMNCSDEQIQILKELCNEFDLSYRIGEGRRSKPSRTVGANEEIDQKGFFIAEDDENFDRLEEGRFYGFTDRSVGKFLGFPKNAIDFFVEEEQPGMESRKTISQLANEGVYGEEIKFLNLVCYIPPPVNSGIDRGIEKGMKREEQLKIFDRINDTNLGEKYIEKRLKRNLYC